MFLSRRISMLLLSISCCFTGLQADFIGLSIWERTTAMGHKQHLICCGDRHDLTSKSDEQSDDLIEFLNQRNNPHDVILIEDRLDYSYIIEQARAYCKENSKEWDESCLQDVQLRYDGEFKLYQEGKLFGYFTYSFPALVKVGQKIAGKENIKSLNVDFRGLADSSTYTCFSEDWVRFLSGGLDNFVVKQIIKEIQKYDDGYFLNSYYQQCIQPLLCIQKKCGVISMRHINFFLRDYESMRYINPFLRDDGGDKLLDFLPHPDSFYHKAYNILYGGRNDAVVSRKYEERDTFSRYLLCELMDARLLHYIYQEQIMQQECANTIAVCAGFNHTSNIEQKLTALGYTCIDRDGASSLDDFKREVSLSGRLKESLDNLYLRQQEAEAERKIKQAQINRCIRHILLGFDVDMGTDVQGSPAKLQAKL